MANGIMTMVNEEKPSLRAKARTLLPQLTEGHHAARFIDYEEKVASNGNPYIRVTYHCDAEKDKHDKPAFRVVDFYENNFTGAAAGMAAQNNLFGGDEFDTFDAMKADKLAFEFWMIRVESKEVPGRFFENWYYTSARYDAAKSAIQTAAAANDNMDI
jgi:hypothetical protein